MLEITYPSVLDTIFEKLNKYEIKPVIVGGFIRDKLLQIDSKDIDIELYNVENIDIVENILQEFGLVNEVGKSFSVIKLKIDDLDLDFSLPREDSKIAKGHKGFIVTANSHLDFKTATSRRDFTINAIGYDTIEKKLLDPFNGIEDLKNKILKAVDLGKFGEDPLRVLRAVQFASRFDLMIDDDLFALSKNMVQNDQLSYLSKERVYGEIEKLLLKAKKPSKGFILMKQLGIFTIFEDLGSLDRSAQLSVDLADKERVILMLLVLSSKLKNQQRINFLDALTNDKEIHHKIENILSYLQEPSYTLAMRLDLALFGKYLEVIEFKEYKTFLQNVVPKVMGKDLIAKGLQPSAKFAKILQESYIKQIEPFLL